MFSGTTSFEIQFGDCDPAGIVYYPNYFRYFDNATAGLISAALGMNKPAWLAEHAIAGIPMVDTGAKFLRPSRFGDRVRIESRFGDLGRNVGTRRDVHIRGDDGAGRGAPLKLVAHALQVGRGLLYRRCIVGQVIDESTERVDDGGIVSAVSG